jgi:hypothetical protein
LVKVAKIYFNVINSVFLKLFYKNNGFWKMFNLFVIILKLMKNYGRLNLLSINLNLFFCLF